MNLFRPVGLEELRLIYEGQMRAFPPRLPDQPIFYPVLNEPYARQIAKDWNTKTGTRSGFVTHFAVDDDYGSRFERRVVGGREHEELWVPAEDLHEFNANLTTPIVVTGAFFGEGYGGSVPENFSLKGKTAVEQLIKGQTSLRSLSRASARVGQLEWVRLFSGTVGAQGDRSLDPLEPWLRGGERVRDLAVFVA